MRKSQIEILPLVFRMLHIQDDVMSNTIMVVKYGRWQPSSLHSQNS